MSRYKNENLNKPGVRRDFDPYGGDEDPGDLGPSNPSNSINPTDMKETRDRYKNMTDKQLELEIDILRGRRSKYGQYEKYEKFDYTKRPSRSAKKRAKRIINKLRKDDFPLSDEGFEILRAVIKEMKSGRLD
jgi:hypothetical protein